MILVKQATTFASKTILLIMKSNIFDYDVVIAFVAESIFY